MKISTLLTLFPLLMPASVLAGTVLTTLRPTSMRRYLLAAHRPQRCAAGGDRRRGYPVTKKQHALPGEKRGGAVIDYDPYA